jgi:hypothetical protein
MQNFFFRFPSRAAIAVATVVLFSSPASGATSINICHASGMCGVARAISDEQLADVAGKFTIAGEVVGMNLTMTSSWQAANGQRLDASASMSVALPASGNTHAHFSTQASVTEPQISGAPANVPTGTVSQGSGVQNVAGVSQVIQVAGNGNGASNRASVHVTTENLAANSGNGRLHASYAASNGAQASVDIGNNAVSLRLAMPAAGSAQQQINGTGMGNLHQNIQIAANGQQVINQMHLQLQLQPYSNAFLTSQGLSNSFNMIRGR